MWENVPSIKFLKQSITHAMRRAYEEKVEIAPSDGPNAPQALRLGMRGTLLQFSSGSGNPIQ